MVIYPYTEWECYRAGMYRDEGVPLQPIHDLFTDLDALRDAMVEVTEAWPRSSSSHLADLHGNRRSWLGQAAAAFRLDAPASATRNVWGSLTHAQNVAANMVADEVLEDWDRGVPRAETLFAV